MVSTVPPAPLVTLTSPPAPPPAPAPPTDELSPAAGSRESGRDAEAAVAAAAADRLSDDRLRQVAVRLDRAIVHHRDFRRHCLRSPPAPPTLCAALSALVEAEAEIEKPPLPPPPPIDCARIAVGVRFIGVDDCVGVVGHRHVARLTAASARSATDRIVRRPPLVEKAAPIREAARAAAAADRLRKDADARHALRIDGVEVVDGYCRGRAAAAARAAADGRRGVAAKAAARADGEAAVAAAAADRLRDDAVGHRAIGQDRGARPIGYHRPRRRRRRRLPAPPIEESSPPPEVEKLADTLKPPFPPPPPIDCATTPFDRSASV